MEHTRSWITAEIAIIPDDLMQRLMELCHCGGLFRAYEEIWTFLN